MRRAGRAGGTVAESDAPLLERLPFPAFFLELETGYTYPKGVQCEG